MRLAAIDCGTNSIHMIVVRIRPDLSFEVIDREKEMVRLGSGGLDGKALTAEAMAAALQAFSRFRRLAESHQVEEILAAATSAVIDWARTSTMHARPPMTIARVLVSAPVSDAAPTKVVISAA